MRQILQSQAIYRNFSRSYVLKCFKYGFVGFLFRIEDLVEIEKSYSWTWTILCHKKIQRQSRALAKELHQVLSAQRCLVSDVGRNQLMEVSAVISSIFSGSVSVVVLWSPQSICISSVLHGEWFRLYFRLTKCSQLHAWVQYSSW